MYDDGLRQEERVYKRPPALPLDVDVHDLLDILHSHLGRQRTLSLSHAWLVHCLNAFMLSF